MIGSLTRFGHSDFATDGFRPNNDLDQSVTNALIQYRPTYGTSLQAELRSTEIESGDLLMLFDQELFDPRERQFERVDSARLGVRRELSAQQYFARFGHLSRSSDRRSTTRPRLLSRRMDTGSTTDLRHIFRAAKWSLDSGFMYFRQERVDEFRQTIPLPVPPFTLDVAQTTDVDQAQRSLYAYAQLQATDDLSLTIGASADDVEGPDISEEMISPKLGLIWEMTDQTTVRAAAFATLQGAWTSSKQNIQPRLEPFQVAGFNQFFVDREGDEARFGGRLVRQSGFRECGDRRGIVQARSDGPVLLRPGDDLGEPVRSTEQFARGYVYWTPRTTSELECRVSAGTNRQRRRSVPRYRRRPHAPVAARRSVLPSVRIQHAFARVVRRARRRLQRRPLSARSAATEFRADEFWVLDASVGYRLRNRRGVISLNVDNLLDESFNFQDIDPLNPSVAPERMAYLRFTLAFE